MCWNLKVGREATRGSEVVEGVGRWDWMWSLKWRGRAL